MKWMTIGLFLLNWGTFTSDAANILAILPTPSFSHQQFYRVFIKELHKRGHNITFVSPNPFNDPTMENFIEVDLSYGYDYMKKNFDISSQSAKKVRVAPEVLLILYWKVVTDLCTMYLENTSMKELYNRSDNYDLFIAEWGMLACIYPYQKLAGKKMIGISSFEVGALANTALANPFNPVVASDISLEYSEQMNFWQRLRSTVFFFVLSVFLRGLRWHETYIARSLLDPNIPYVLDLEGNVSLIMDNSHFTMSFPKPMNLNFISLGGTPFHLNGRKMNKLPWDIKTFMDDAPDGVIYFSLGTNVKTTNISSKEEKILLETFGKLKQKVLWKWENDNLKLNLKNVMKAKWFPQVEVLAHPNTKAFVTQAGLQSISEAIEFQVPMIVMPFFADQNHNARKMESVGAAIYMDFDVITVESFSKALNDIVFDKKYKQNMIKFSNLVKDQPIPTLEKAVWWTEYVIRHNGAPHLKSIATKLNWFIYLNLDVIATLFTMIFFVIYIIRKLLKVFLSKTFPSKSKKD